MRPLSSEIDAIRLDAYMRLQVMGSSRNSKYKSTIYVYLRYSNGMGLNNSGYLLV